MKKIGVSACLLGHNVRYDGNNQKNEKLLKLLEGHEVIYVCPETFGGLPTPRFPAEIIGDKVININGDDVTSQYNKGAKLSYEKIKDCDFVILKAESPSCGYKKIFDGSFSGKFIDGNGVFVQMCLEHKIKVFTEEDLDILQTLL